MLKNNLIKKNAGVNMFSTKIYVWNIENIVFIMQYVQFCLRLYSKSVIPVSKYENALG